jgi:hypothetical protein
MRVDSGDQQVAIVRPLLVDLVIDDDQVFRLLQFRHLAELIGLAGLPLRMTSVDGSNTLTSLPSVRVLPRKMRARIIPLGSGGAPVPTTLLARADEVIE